MLSELHDWTSWHLLFEQELGALPDFLQEQGALADSPLSYQSHLILLGSLVYYQASRQI